MASICLIENSATWSPILWQKRSMCLLQPPQSALPLPYGCPINHLDVVAVSTGIRAYQSSQFEVGLSSTPTLPYRKQWYAPETKLAIVWHFKDTMGNHSQLVYGGHKCAWNKVIFIPKSQTHNQENSNPQGDSITYADAL